MSDVCFAELGVTSNFSFLRGGSHPAELIERAAELGLAAIAIADRNSFAGIVRAHVAMRDAAAQNPQLRLVIGTRLVLKDGLEALAFPTDRAAYSDLSRLLTLGNRRAPKGECHLDFTDLIGLGKGHRFILMPPAELNPHFAGQHAAFAAAFPGRVYLALTPCYRPDDRSRMAALADAARRHRTPLIATNDVLYHRPERRPLQDVLTCIREHCTIDEAGFRLERNAERHLKSGAEMHRLLAGYEDAVARTIALAGELTFSLDDLDCKYPVEAAGKSATPQAELERLTWEGAKTRFSSGFSEKTRKAVIHELKLIGELGFASYFLTVHDIVHYARTRTPPILCQGRGSSANSVVCYCLGITSVNPDEIDLLFERFVSAERGEPPDIDVDFEHERREEVIQYIYAKYGRHRASLAATVIRYRARSAINNVGKAMGLSPDVVQALSGLLWGWSSSGPKRRQIAEAGLEPDAPRLRQALILANQLIDFPRHLSQHVGGFVISDDALDEVVPIANAAMEDRTVIEWDKDDLDALGILKVDVLSLGMLTCLQKAFTLLGRHYGKPYGLASVPRDDGPTYEMIQAADTVGVFQIESRAQMSMLPRLRPKDFYDLVIEIAIVRPGPIQGDMVHPYLRRRQELEPVEYPSEALRAVLQKTLGVPLFQEQAMKIAIVGAGFTPDKADRLRKAMASFRNHGTIDRFREEFVAGMIENGYAQDFATGCFKQIEGFSDYGFPESHSASFALLAYASAWLKCHYPEVFACALLNAQPMGFYSAASIIRDLRDHDGAVRPVDINHSCWDHTLEPLHPSTAKTSSGGNAFALRLGFRQIDGMREAAGDKIAKVREKGFDSIRDLFTRTGLEPSVLTRLAHADAFGSLGLDRRAALWKIRGLTGYLGKRDATHPKSETTDKSGTKEEAPSSALQGPALSASPPQATLPLFADERDILADLVETEEAVTLPDLMSGEQVVEDYRTLHLSLKAHPVSFLRPVLKRHHIVTATSLKDHGNGRRVELAGLVLVRQRPGTASGVVFLTLEDETGIGNIIIWPKILTVYRRIVLGARMIAVKGRLQKQDGVIHVVAEALSDLTPELMQTLSAAPLMEHTEKTGNLWRHPRNTRVLPRGRNFH